MNHAKSNGFTMIELMLAMTFIAMLLLAVAMTTIQVSHIYNKGITLREVNQAGRAVTAQLQQDISSSAPFDVSANPSTTRFISRTGGGRLCMGQYTYVWNYGKALAGGAGAPSIVNKYSDQTPVRFVRVADPSAALCTAPTSLVDKRQATELLTGSGGDRSLALQVFSISEKADTLTAPGQALYTAKLTLGTNDQAQLASNDASCQPPSDGVGDEDYCSVNEFTVVAQAGMRSEGGD